MKKNTYFLWNHASGASFWQPKKVHDCLIREEMTRRYMKMIGWTGLRKNFTKAEWLGTKIMGVV